jgi:LDH2 family malate/lactate/ureidoglycolate dehydrogenase
MKKIPANQLHDFSYKIFKSIGCNDEEANLASAVLISADLRGVDSHGVARLSGYIRLYEKDRLNPKPNIRIIHETPSTAVVDGDKGLGLVVAPKAMEIAIEKAKTAGSGWVSVKDTNHFGIAGYHSMMALDHDMIGLAMTNASPLVSPTFSRERMLGTNPISVAIPALSEPPFVADFATTTAANGKLEILQRLGKDAPLGWIQDKDGHPTTNSHAVKEGGALLPLGGDREHGSHKGFILGSIVDIFSGVFSGSGFGPWAPPFVSFLPMPEDPPGEGLGHFFGAIRTDAFRPSDEFKAHMDVWIRRFRDAEPVEDTQPVVIPGDPEREMEIERLKSGIPLNDKVVADLESLSEKFDISL